ncbi:hypothetical protein Taro_019936, partial [Colocasia esculenta]|nr:hypothetical protein [Colocasia esculenta]
MVAAERPAATALAVRVAAGVSVAAVVLGGRVVGVDATYQAVVTAFPIFEGSCLWRAVRGGDDHSYEKTLTGFLEGLLRNPAQLVTRQPRRLRSCRDGASGRDMVATLLSIDSLVSLPSSDRARVRRRRRGDVCYSPSGSPWPVGGDRENRVLGVGR